MIAGGLLTQLEQDLHYTLVHGDVIHIYLSLIPFEDPVYKNMNRPLAVSAVNKRISEQVYEQARQGRYVLTLGGDHSISIGTLAGTAEATRERLPGKELAVLWVDAHADINTPDTTISGNIHGMALAFSTGLAKGDREDVFGWLRKEQLIDKKRLVYIALRDLDEAEEVILKENDIKRFKMADVKRYISSQSPPPPVLLTNKPDRPNILNTNRVTDNGVCTVTGLNELWTWHWTTLVLTIQSIFRLTLMLSTLVKHPARALPCPGA